MHATRTQHKHVARCLPRIVPHSAIIPAGRQQAAAACCVPVSASAGATESCRPLWAWAARQRCWRPPLAPAPSPEAAPAAASPRAAVQTPAPSSPEAVAGGRQWLRRPSPAGRPRRSHPAWCTPARAPCRRRVALGWPGGGPRGAAAAHGPQSPQAGAGTAWPSCGPVSKRAHRIASTTRAVLS